MQRHCRGKGTKYSVGGWPIKRQGAKRGKAMPGNRAVDLFFFFLNFQFSQTNGLAALGNDSEKSPGHSAFSAARVAHWLRIATEFGQAPPWDDKGASAHACEKEL